MTLARDVEKTRDWQRRSAETAAARRAERLRRLAECGELPTMRPVSEARMGREGEKIARAGSTIIEKGRGMAAAPAQQRKTREAGGCRILAALADLEQSEWPREVVDALTAWQAPAPVDSAHIAGPHDCEHPHCTCELIRPLHRAYDLRRLSLLRYLTLDEQVHAVEHVGILGAYKRTTNRDWEPVHDTAGTTRDRLPLLTEDEQAEHVRLEGGIYPGLVVLTGTDWHPVEVIA